MTDVLVARPDPVSRVWSGRKVIAEDVQGDDLADVLQLHADASAWWVLPRGRQETGAELRRAANELDLDELAIHDLLADDNRAKYEELGQSRLVLTNAVALDHGTGDLTAHPVSLVVTDRALICLVDSAAGGLRPSRLLVDHAEQLADGGVERALQCVLGALVEGYEDVVEWIEGESDDLANSLFDESPLSREDQVRAFRLRTALSGLRRVTDPMRAVLDDLVAAQPPAEADRRWSAIREHHTRVANAADALREALASVLDTSLALADLRMNGIMKKLTGWAAIIAVPTLVTGFAGMNVGFPLDGTSTGFWVYLALMAVAVVVLYVTFRKRDWL